MMIETINPATGEPLQQYVEATPQEIISAIDSDSAQKAYLAWRETDFEQRAEHMHSAADVLRQNAPEYCILMAEEMGKTKREGLSEIEKCAWVCEYYAENARKFLQDETIDTDAARSYVAFKPLGVILAVMPWNFPFWQVFRFAAPGLMAGNTALLKHASNVPGCALAIADVFRKAGFPEKIFQSLLIGSDAVRGVIEHPMVQAVTLTGSTPAGRAVAATAGEMLKKTVLELGGSDPYIILHDADLDAAVRTCTTSRLINAGQSCIAAKRFIVVEPVLREFEKKFTAEMSTRVMGHPLLEDTDYGPQARVDLRDQLHAQVSKSIGMGARCLLGGILPEGPGAFYPATVLTDVRKGMPAFDEELFGPVAAIITAKDETQAIAIANDSAFGLGAAVFTDDTARGNLIASTKLEAGSCFVNTFVKSDPRLPFGGIKKSGYGRELSWHGIREFVNVKTVYIA
jgi:succinate-semialdehyde dehydrogenase/glutarate-semialdehyde dehydrogenase